MRQTAAGAASAGKVLADFTIRAYNNGVYYDCTPTIAEIETTGAWTTYILEVVLDAGTPYWNHIIVQPASGTDLVYPAAFSGEIESQDLDSIYGVVSRPTASLSDASLLSSEVQIEIIANRYNTMSLAIVDQAGDPVDLSTHDNWLFNVWDKTHSGSILYSDALDITGSIGG
ncbi:MAG: hypothetical protein WC069_06525, partial [Candidatus Shapirobacteria bacterium]